MADLDDIKEGKDFRTDQPQKNIPFTLKVAVRWIGECSHAYRGYLIRKRVKP